jgi:hypothetical protein
MKKRWQGDAHVKISGLWTSRQYCLEVLEMIAS